MAASLWRTYSAAASGPSQLSRWQRFTKGRIGVWCRNIWQDYLEAGLDILRGMRDRPVQATAYGVVAAAVATSIHKSPGMDSFEVALTDAANDLLTVPEAIRNLHADNHVQMLLRLQANGRLRLLSLGFCTFLYEAPHDSACCSFESACAYMKPRWRDFPQRLRDVGFLGRWWLLDRNVVNSDINDLEFAQLPAELHIIRPSDLNSQHCEALHDLRDLNPLCLPKPDPADDQRYSESDGQVNSSLRSSTAQESHIHRTGKADVQLL
uniref:mitochondrial import inner membrane translocase subunit Tim29 isoform X2 n=1 Tax=Myxine glutinosa TaxID=7769 RepID=UPI00358DDCB1